MTDIIIDGAANGTEDHGVGRARPVLHPGTGHSCTNAHTISGTVTWKGGARNGDPVVGGSITIGPGNDTGTTDASGPYSIAGVGERPHTIHVKSPEPNGSVTRAVVVNQDKTVDIRMTCRQMAITKRNGGIGLQKQ